MILSNPQILGCLPLYRTMSQFNPVPILLFCITKIACYIIHPIFALVSQKDSSRQDLGPDFCMRITCIAYLKVDDLSILRTLI
jgi:hypothetical protein